MMAAHCWCLSGCVPHMWRGAVGKDPACAGMQKKCIDTTGKA